MHLHHAVVGAQGEEERVDALLEHLLACQRWVGDTCLRERQGSLCLAALRRFALERLRVLLGALDVLFDEIDHLLVAKVVEIFQLLLSEIDVRLRRAVE